MRVLHFAPRICWPLDTGAKLRNFHLGRLLAENAQVTFLGFQHEGEPSAIPQAGYEEVVAVKRDGGYTIGNTLRGALGKVPLPLLNYTTEPMKQALSRLLAKKYFDVVQVESIHLLGYLPILRAAGSHPLIVCDWHNIESELMRRYGEREGSSLKQSYARRTAKLMMEAELQATHDFDAHVTVSKRDAEHLHQLNPSARVCVIENGVDAAHYADEQLNQAYSAWPNRNASGPSPRRIVFVGSMDYHANIDGVTRFSDRIWPSLRVLYPDLVFTIVGRNPAPEVRDLAMLPGVEVTGTVDDVRPYYREAAVSVVPLQVGGGSRLKILESMAAGVPVVSTTLGAEGLDTTNNQHILIADSNESMIDAVREVIENQAKQEQLIAEGRALVFSKYDWSTVGASLVKNYIELLADVEHK